MKYINLICIFRGRLLRTDIEPWLGGCTLCGFEFKHTTSPRVTPSMRNALVELKLDRIDVIHAGSETYPLSEKIVAISSSRLMDVFADF